MIWIGIGFIVAGVMLLRRSTQLRTKSMIAEDEEECAAFLKIAKQNRILGSTFCIVGAGFMISAVVLLAMIMTS